MDDMIPDNNPDTREKLIRAAEDLFAHQGFDGTTVKDIADRAGVNVSLISYHFGGKENLYKACLERFGKERLAVSQRILQKPNSVEELRVRLELYIEEFLVCNLEQGNVVTLLHRECEMQMPIAEDIFRSTFMKNFETLVQFLKNAQDSGIIKKDLDVLVAAAGFFGGAMHFARNNAVAEKFFGRSIRDPDQRRNVIDTLIRLFMNGAIETSSKG